LTARAILDRDTGVAIGGGSVDARRGTARALRRRGGARREEGGRMTSLLRLAALLALLVITRYMQYDRDTQRICADDSSASVCQR